MKLLAMSILVFALAGCATTSSQYYSGIKYHEVQGGETLYKISKMYNVSVDELSRLNNVTRPYALTAGQRLAIPIIKKISAPVVEYKTQPTYSYSSVPVTPVSERFSWPVKGTIISGFGAKLDNAKNKGIDIRVSDGASIRASRSGRVVYVDEKLKGLGKTIIIDHGDNFQTVYAYNSQILASPGAVVKKNDVIARAGCTGRTDVASLHFEIRKAGEPQNPLVYLSSK